MSNLSTVLLCRLDLSHFGKAGGLIADPNCRL